jgi:hypothetical protein
MSIGSFEPPSSTGEILFYQTEDGRTRQECRWEGESLWPTQATIAELYQVTPQNITLDLKAIYEEGGLDQVATCKDYLQVQAEGDNNERRRNK